MTSTAWQVRGVVLPEEEVRTLYLVGDRITYERVRGARPLISGGWIVPGLVDAHCHIGLRTGGSPVRDVDEAKSLAVVDRDTGVLAIRDAGSPVPYPRLDDDPDLPRLIRAGRHLAAPGAYLPGVAVECGPQELPAAVAAQAKAGNGWVKLVGDWIDRDAGDLAPAWDTGAVRAAIETAHAAGARVAAHAFGEACAAQFVEAGVDSVEHGTGLSGDLVNAMARRGTALVPTMLAIASFRSIAAVADTAFPSYAAHLRKLQAGCPAVVRAAYEAGVAIYVGSDAGCDVRHGRLADEMLLLHREAGMAAADVMAAASWRAREWLGLGGLVEGGPADLVVYDTDPRQDLATVRSPARIVLRGRVIR